MLWPIRIKTITIVHRYWNKTFPMYLFDRNLGGDPAARTGQVSRQMLTLLTKQVRGWAAGMLVAAYAVGVLAPSVAFSLDGGSIVHSLTEVHGGLLLPHLHHDHAGHKSSGKGAPGGSHHCCGVLALPGLPPPAEISVADPVCASLVSTVPQDNLAACGPAQLERPPRQQP